MKKDSDSAVSRILVIDDEESFRQVILKFLAKQGFEAVPAADGQTGVRVAAEMLPDLIVCDLNMPGMQGKFMKESYPRKWVLEPRRPQADGFCIFAGARFLAAVKCRIRFSAGWFWAAQSLVWT